MNIENNNAIELDLDLLETIIYRGAKLAIKLRYIILIPALFFLYFFRYSLPFPYPHFFIVGIIFICGNIALHIFSLFRASHKMLIIASVYVDITVAPLIFYCTGGFLSPFIAVHIITVICYSFMYPGGKHTLRNIYLMLTIGYSGIALLQKYGFLFCHVDYARQMMANNTFFYFVVLMINAIIGLGYVLLKATNARRNHELVSLQNIYENIVKGTSGVVGEDLFQSLVQHLAEALHIHIAVCGVLSNDNTKVTILSAWSKDHFLDEFSFPWSDCPLRNAREGDSIYIDNFHKNDYASFKWACGVEQGSCLGQILRDGSGRAIGILYVVHSSPITGIDIAKSLIKFFASRAATELERKREEEEKEKIADQLAQSQKLEAIGQLAGGIAHDFNNILSGIMSYSQLLQMKLGKTHLLVEFPEKIIALSKRASALTSQLLTFARKGKFTTDPIDIHESIFEVSHMLEHTIDKRIAVKQNLRSTISTVLGDFSQMENMLINLAINARDAMPNGGELVFRTDTIAIDEQYILSHSNTQKCKAGDYLLITVSDTGKGMDRETMSHIFEPFFTTKQRGKGTGLGLAAVYGYVEGHGGFIEVESEINKGTTFKIYLPLYKKAGLKREDTGKFIFEIKDKGASLLLIDDEEDILDSLSKSLFLYGYKIKAFQNGIEAIGYFKKSFNDIDLVILDMNMPKMSGTQVFKKMKKINPMVKVLITTGESIEKETQKLIYYNGVVDMMQKPFRPDKLVRVIEKVLTKN